MRKEISFRGNNQYKYTRVEIQRRSRAILVYFTYIHNVCGWVRCNYGYIMREKEQQCWRCKWDQVTKSFKGYTKEIQSTLQEIGNMKLRCCKQNSEMIRFVFQRDIGGMWTMEQRKE